MDNQPPDTTEQSNDEYEGFLSPSLELQRPLGFKFRFTFSNQDKEYKCHDDPLFVNRTKTIHGRILNKLLENNYVHENRVTSGYEVLNKMGERTHAHIHIHFKSTHRKESIRRTLKRYLEDTYDEDTTGNKAMSLVIEHELRSDEKFYRYPLKQGLDKKKCRGFTEKELEHFHAVAKDSYDITCQVNQQKADKADTTDTLFLRLTQKLSKLELKDTLSLRIATSQFYAEEDRPINLTVMAGYVRTFQLKTGLITHAQLWENTP